MKFDPESGDVLSLLKTGESVQMVKVCKSGLYQVRRIGIDYGSLVSVPKKELTFATESLATQIMAQLRARLEKAQPEGWYDSWSGVFQVEGERRRMEHPDRAVPLYSLEQIERALKGY